MSGGTSVAQIYNSEQVDLLATHFPRRGEATLAWGNILSMFSLLPGLRGFWPMSTSNDAGATYDQSACGRHLTYNGNPLYYGIGLAPYIEFDGTGDYLSRADEAGLDILGTETFMGTDWRGLTIGGWFYLNSLAPGHNYGLIGKWKTSGSNDASYLLYWDDTTNKAAMAVSADGSTVVQCLSSAVLAANNWYFIVGRFDPSAEVAIWLNGVKTANAVGIPASLFSGAADFNIGAYDNGATALLHGGCSLCFLTGSCLTETIIQALYHHSRALYGVR